MLKENIEKLIQGQDLKNLVCQKILNDMMTKEINPIQTAAFLVLLRSKKETPDELIGMVTALKNKIIKVPTHHKVLDIVGTGGDAKNTFNISTGSAILAASCGIKVAKHGNRAVSSQAGSADVLESLGISIDLTPEQIARCIDEVGIGFCFSPNFNPALRTLSTLRKQLNVPTTLNLLGPLLNPTDPSHVILGVFDAALVLTIAKVLKQMGTVRSVVVHGSGLDEISCAGPVSLLEVDKEKIIESTLDPQKLGFNRCTIKELQGGNAKTNAEILLKTFSKKYSIKTRAYAETLILNAGVALYIYGAYLDLNEAIAHAKENLYRGNALTLLNQWKACANDQ